MARRDPHPWTLLRLPERELTEILLEVAMPLFEKLGSAPPTLSRSFIHRRSETTATGSRGT